MAKLAVIAGQGSLPVKIAQRAVNTGHDVIVMPIKGQADADFSHFDSVPITLGTIGNTLAQLQAHDCDRLVMSGKVVRPSLSALKPDAAALKLLGKVMTKGDDSLLRVISDYFAKAGIKTLSPEMFMPDHFAPEGLIAGCAPSAGQQADIALGTQVLGALGALDVGQSLIVQNGRVIAIEAAEGTNEMLRRCKNLVDIEETPAILIKMPKSGQDAKLDVPTIGAETIHIAAESNVGVIGVLADGVLFADSLDVMRQLCEQHEVSLIGLTGER